MTTEGEEGILAHHAPFLSALKPGVLRANIIENGARDASGASNERRLFASPAGSA